MRRALALVVSLLVLAVSGAAAGAARAAGSYNGLAATPPMGFNDWNAYACHVSARLIESSASYLHSSGMEAAGYRYVNIDDCWMAPRRTASGRLRADPVTFPGGIPAVARYVHRLGLKLGIYEDAGTTTCGGFPGSYSHEATDARTFANWGVDYVKYDQCNVPYGLYPALDHEQIDMTLYRTMSRALRATGRPIVFSMCNGADPTVFPWRWGARVSNLWRTTTDIQDNFASTLRNFQGNVDLYRDAGPGAFNDPDMLEIGNGGQTAAEYRSQFSLWAEMAAPLIAGTDLRALSRADRAIYEDRAVIAVDQDALGRQGRPLARAGGLWVLTKPLAGGDHAVVLFNATARAAVIHTTAAAIGARRARVYGLTDLWSGAVTQTAGRIAAFVPPHGTVMYRVGGSVTGVAPSTPLSVTAAPETVRPGGRVAVTVSLSDDARARLAGGRLSLTLPAGWRLAGSGAVVRPFAALGPGASERLRAVLTAPARVAPLSVVELTATAVVAGDRSVSARAPVTVQSPVAPPFLVADTTGEPATSGQSGSSFSILAAGTGVAPQVTSIHGTSPPADAFAAVYSPGADQSDSTARVTLTRLDGSALYPYGAAGLLIRDQMAAIGSPEGVALSVSTAGRLVLSWNAGGGADVDSVSATHRVVLPVTLRLIRCGSRYAAAYSTDGDRGWTNVGTATVATPASTGTQDVGVFHASGVPGWDTVADFAGFTAR